MRKIILMAVIITLFSNTSYASEKKWSDEDLYLFTAVVSSQIADYTQSVKFNNIITKNECGFLDTPQPYVTESGATGLRWYDCMGKNYLDGEEGNPLVRRQDGGFAPDRALLLGAGLDVGLLYLGTKHPKWRRPLLYIVYIAEMLAVQNNIYKGFKPDFPVLPIVITYNF